MTVAAAPVRTRHDIRNAWLSLVVIPAALVVADGVLHGVLGLMGVDEAADDSATLLQALVAGVPYALVMMLPGIGGFWFGTNALGNGDRRGRVPSALGALWMVVVLVGSIAFLIMSQLGG